MNAISLLRDAQVAAARVQEVQQRIEALCPRRQDEELDPLIHGQAIAQSHADAQEAERLRDGFRAVFESATDVREAAIRGDITVDEAVARLAEAQRGIKTLRQLARSLETRYATTAATIANPAARRAELLAKYPGLRK